MEIDAGNWLAEEWLRVCVCGQTEEISNGKWIDNKTQLPRRGGLEFLAWRDICERCDFLKHRLRA